MHDDYTYFQDHEFRTSLAAYERMQAGGESAELDAETLTDIAEFYAMSHRHEEANRCIDYALAFYPDSVDPKIFLARQQMFRDNMKEAWKICNSIPEQDDREVIFLRAELFLHEQKGEEGIMLLYNTYMEDEDDPAEFLYDSIGVLKDYGYIELAIEWSESLRQEYPDYKAVIPLEAEAYNQTERYAEAAKLMEPYVMENPYDTQGWIQMCDAQLGLGKHEEALEAIDYVLAINPEHAEATLMRGNIFYDKGEVREALTHYRKFLEYYPDDITAMCMEIQSLVDLEEYETAIERLHFMLRHNNPYLPGYCYSYLAYCHDRLHHDEECLRYRKMAEKEPYNNLSYLFPDLYPSKDAGSPPAPGNWDFNELPF